jgi:hypothetical protein
MNTRFYVYLPEQDTVDGPLAWDQLEGLGDDALVMTEERQEYWPLRRWKESGELTVTAREHYQAWVWLLAFVPAGAWFFMPELLRMEWGIAWLIAMTYAFIGFCVCKKDYPRFPERKLEH